MIWYCLLGYVLFSQLLMCTLIQRCMVDLDSPGNEWLNSLNRNQKRKLVLLSGFASVVAGPVLLPVILFDCMFGASAKKRKAELKFWTEFKRRFRPLILDPVHRYNINERLWDFFEYEQPAFDALNFQVLGEFVLKDEPLKIEARLLLHPKGACIAEVGQVGDNHYVELTSFLEDGSVVCTSTGNELEIRDKLIQSRYHCFSHPNADSLELLEQHESHLEECLTSQDCALRSVVESDWKAYLRYSNQRFGEILHELGEHDNRPDTVKFPSAENTFADGGSPAKAATDLSEVPVQQGLLRVYRGPADQ